MKTNKLIVLLMVFFLVCTAILAGCGDKKGSVKRIPLSFATAGTGGSFYPLGGGIAKIINAHYPQYNVSAEATGGSVENIRLFDGGQADVAFISADTAFEAYKGIGADFSKPANVLALMTTYNQPTHIIVKKGSGITKLQDLKGKRVAVGSPGSGTEHKTALILNALGMSYNDITAMYLSFAEAVTAFQDNQIDAAIMGVGAPASAVMDLATSVNIDILSIPQKDLDTIISKYPYFQVAVMPTGTYEAVPHDVTTIGAAILICVRADLDEQIAYDLTKTMLGYPAEITAVHALGASFNLKNALPTVIPLHPGAKRYYSENNVPLP